MERRYERIRPAEMRQLVAAAPVAWVPIGTLEWHGEHLPFGVDAFEAHGLCLRTAERVGGVVLPPTYLASGVLSLAWSLSFDLELVLASVKATVAELARQGFHVVVLLTGHGPLDLNHGLKRVAAELEACHHELLVYALCWLELNAARLGEAQRGEPKVVDHAALVETSYMLALEPGLVALERLPDDPEARPLGVYGRNPRFTASQEWGDSSLALASELLAERVSGLLRGERLDSYADLRRFVELCWPEPLERSGRAGRPNEAALLVTNPGLSSRYVTSFAAQLDGERIDRVALVNENPGESGRPHKVAELGYERGFYIRRQQTARALLGCLVESGPHEVCVTVGLGGVLDAVIDATVDFEPA